MTAMFEAHTIDSIYSYAMLTNKLTEHIQKIANLKQLQTHFKAKCAKGVVWYGLILHFCDSNHEITRSSKRKYNNIKDH